MEHGVPLSEIPDKQFLNIQVNNPDFILRGLEQCSIAYHAKINDHKMLIAFIEKDRDRVSDIIERSNRLSVNAEFHERVEQLRSGENQSEAVQALLPEIAAVLHVSVSSLERKPPDLQFGLALTYTSLCFSDDLTIKQALQEEIQLNHEANTEIKELLEKRTTAIQPLNKTEKLRQQQEDDQKKKEAYVSRDVLKRNAQKVQAEKSNEYVQRSEKEYTEHLERTKKPY